MTSVPTVTVIVAGEKAKLAMVSAAEPAAPAGDAVRTGRAKMPRTGTTDETRRRRTHELRIVSDYGPAAHRFKG